MNDEYEFRVTGAIGPLTRAALPELESYRCEQETTITGTAPDEQHILALLDHLDNADLTANDIIITRMPQRPEM